MLSTVTLEESRPRDSRGAERGTRFRLFHTLARGFRRILDRPECGADERRSTTGMLGAAGTRVIDAAGNLRDTRVLQGLQRRCEQALSPGRRNVAVDLANVTSADTKLVATLVALRQRAKSVDVPLELTVSSPVYHWITLCRVERLLEPRCPRPVLPTN